MVMVMVIMQVIMVQGGEREEARPRQEEGLGLALCKDEPCTAQRSARHGC